MADSVLNLKFQVAYGEAIDILSGVTYNFLLQFLPVTFATL